MNSEYASALFNLGKEENILDNFYNEIKLLIEIFKDNEIDSFISNKFVNSSNKKSILDKYLKDINKYLINFINIIIDDNKEEYLIDIFDEFNELYYKEKNISKGIIYGLEIDDDKIKKLEEVFTKKLNKKVILSFKQDISLIGGFKVIVDNKLYDNSYKTKLNNLKKELLKEGENND